MKFIKIFDKGWINLKKIYVDNASTAFPKAPSVGDTMKHFLDNVGCNLGRGGYESAYHVALEVLQTKKLLCELFNFNQPRNVIFTPGLTYSINMILQGFLQAGDHLITSSMEHNAVMRPLHALSKRGVTYSVAQCQPDGTLVASEVAKLINHNTKAIAITHASNVCGTILPLEEIAQICHSHKLKLIVDTAQTAGLLNLDMSQIDALAFTCHKGLLAASGLGGFIVKSEFASQINPIITGGTGSASHEFNQPSLLPDKFEVGTLNIPAIMGLKASLEYLKSTGIATIFKQTKELTERFIAEISKIDDIDIIGKQKTDNRVAIVSLNFKNQDNAEIASLLDSKYQIMTRCGLHCAPNAHKTLGTYPSGTIRFSFSHFNTPSEITTIVDAVKDILNKGETYGF